MDDEPEIYITGPGERGPGEPSPQPSRRSGRGPGRLRWVAVAAGFAVLIAVVAVQHHLGGTGTDATPGPTTSSHTSSPAPSSTPTSNGPTSRTSSTGTTAPQQGSPPTRVIDKLGTAIGPCGEQEYVASVGYVSRPPEPIDVTVLTGTHPRLVDLAEGAASPQLIDLPSTEVVLDIATDSDGTVMIKQSCTDRMTSALVRVPRGGHPARAIPASHGWNVMGLIQIDGHIWAVIARRSGDANAINGKLLATDGIGRTISLPSRFIPTYGWDGHAVGRVWNATSTVARYDLAHGGKLTPIVKSVGQFVVGDGALYWTPPCGDDCRIHRLDLATGRDRVTAANAGSDGRWLAVSPDGSRMVETTLEPSGPAGYTLQVIDLATGMATVVPGLHLGAASPSVAFSPDSRWLIVTVPTLIGGRILLYNADLHGPYATGVVVPGPQIGSIPLDVAGGHRDGDPSTDLTSQPPP